MRVKGASTTSSSPVTLLSEIIGVGDVSQEDIVAGIRAFVFDETLDLPAGGVMPERAPIATLVNSVVDLLSGRLSERTADTSTGQKVLVRTARTLLTVDKRRRALMRQDVAYEDAMFAALTTAPTVAIDRLLEMDLTKMRDDTFGQLSSAARAFLDRLVF